MTIKELCKMIRVGDLANVKKFLTIKKNINLNGTAEWFEPPLQTTLKFFEGTVPVPSMYLGPMTPLCTATTYCYFDIVKILVESGKVDINAKSGREKDHTPLDCAIKWCEGADKEKIIKYLESKGAKRNITKREKTSLENLGEGLLGSLGEIPKIATTIITSRL